MIVVELLAVWNVPIAFSPTGHGLMTLIISFLVVAKVNMSYDRYMSSRHEIGHALACLRELNQTSLVYSQKYRNSEAAKKWVKEVCAARWTDLVKLETRWKLTSCSWIL